MNKKILFGLLTGLTSLSIVGCGSSHNGQTQIDYEVQSRDRYDNIYRENIPNQWENYGIGDPFLLRYNGEYYLFVSTKDGNPGYKVWKSHNLVQFEYIDQYMYYSKDGYSTDRHLGQYAPEVYYWNGDFYQFGSPSGNGHYIYKSTTGLPYGDYIAVTDNFGCSIDGSVFIDDDETMTFLTAGNGAIQAYEMPSIDRVDATTQTALLSPLIKWTEGPCIIKHNDTYFLTYTGNHVKSRGYRVDYSYSNTDPFSGFKYPANNSILLNTLSNQNGLGHSSNVLGPNLDSYYISYHSLDDASGPIRSYNLNRLSFSDNRMSVYGPTEKGALVPLMPDFINYEGEDKMVTEGDMVLSNIATGDRFSAEYNFREIQADGSAKFVFASNGDANNYITINGHAIELYVNNAKIGEGSLVHDFDFTKLHTIRLNVEQGHYRVFFDNMKKIEVKDQVSVSGGKIGYKNVTNIGATSFSNQAFDSSDRIDPKVVQGDWFATTYLEQSKLTEGKSYTYTVDNTDEMDYDTTYADTTAVKLANPGDYLLYPIDVFEDSRYGIEMLHSQQNVGAKVSIQVDNEPARIFEIGKVDFSKNMNSYEDGLKFIKEFVADVDVTKGLHTIKFELVSGEVDAIYFNMFKETKYNYNFSNDLSNYVTNGSNYLSLWKLADDNGTICHKAKAGVNNMVLFGDQTLTDYEVSVDIKISVSAATNSMVGLIVRCNNPSLYSGYVDESAQGYLIGFNRLQLKEQKINYSSSTVAVDTTESRYTLGEWHNVRVICEDNRTTTYFDNELIFSYTDPYPFSHGLVALYSINAESFYKNLSIKSL